MDQAANGGETDRARNLNSGPQTYLGSTALSSFPGGVCFHTFDHEVKFTQQPGASLPTAGDAVVCLPWRTVLPDSEMASWILPPVLDNPPEILLLEAMVSFICEKSCALFFSERIYFYFFYRNSQA